MSAAQDLAHLLLSTAAGFFLAVIWLRFLLQYLSADFYNPVSQWVEWVSRPVLQPLRKALPRSTRFDWAALVMIVMIKTLELTLYSAMEFHQIIPFVQLMFTAFYALAVQLLYFYQGMLILLMIMSWVVAAGGYHPLYALLLELSEPLCAPARKILPPVAGIDFSLMLVFFALQILQVVVQHVFLSLGAMLL